MTFSGDSHKLVSGSNDWVVQAWDAHNGEILSVLYGHSSQVNSVVYTPSGDYIASGSWDGTVRIWKAGGSLPDAFSEGDRNIWTCIAISPSGGNIVIGGKNGELQLWESLTGKPTVILQGHEGSIRALAFSHCGLQIASAGLGTVKLWCSWSGECLHVLKGHHGAVFSLVFSPNDREIAHSGSDPAIRIWNAQTGDRKHILEGHTHEVMCVAYSPSGRQIASCGSDKTIRLWHAETGEQLHILNQDCAAYRVMYSLDEKELVLASSNPDTVSCWDLGSKESFERQEMSELSVTACCISPDRSMIATGDLEGFLRLWNRKSPIWKQVFHSRIGVTLELQWKQGPGCTYLSSIDNGLTRFWRLVETDGTFDLRLVWSTGMRELTFEGANLCGVVGLSPVHLKLVEQRGANTDSPRMVPRN
ncbi:hypothetical protein EC991_007994 [Linnemannia zychae]|nr:hypothetical protein EC991_007994 [Linnemannia zychae]